MALPGSRQLEIIERELSSLKDHEQRMLKEILARDLARAFIPNPGPQTWAYNSEADVLLYGGAAGGGKSALLIGLAGQDHERSLILRRQAAELDGLIDFSRDVLAQRGSFVGGHEKVWTLDDGAQIKFGGCKEKDKWRDYAGRARDFLGLDEAGEFLEEQAASLIGWVRSTKEGQRCRTVLASNPPRGAEGEWMIRWFAPWLDEAFPDPAQPGELRWCIRVNDEIEWVDGPGEYDRGDPEPYTARSHTFIPAMLDDNPYLRQTGYRATLQNLPEPLRSQLLKGDFLAGREDDAWQVIPSDWVEAAFERHDQALKPNAPQTSVGIDVAQGGSDLTSLAPRYGTWFDKLQVHKGVDTKDGPQVAALAILAQRDSSQLVIDLGGGWGGSAYDHLKENESPIIGVNPAEGSLAKTRDGKLGFRNLRAEHWWKLREALDPQHGENLALPRDPALKADLTAPTWKLTASGIQIESKEDVRGRLGRSTDRADAVILAWAHGEYRAAQRAGHVRRQTKANVGYGKAKKRGRR
ncbi:MAG: terminase [Pseudomonadota bacterium]